MTRTRMTEGIQKVTLHLENSKFETKVVYDSEYNNYTEYRKKTGGSWQFHENWGKVDPTNMLRW